MLRTDLFPTVDRAETRFIAVRDALTDPEVPHDIKAMDARHCKQGRLGVGWHFFVTTSGTIQLGRDLNSCGSHTRTLDTSSVAIGVEGGVDENGDRKMTRNTEQASAIDDLTAFMRSIYPQATVSDTPNP